MSTKSETAILGRMPQCGHIVAIDLDPSPKARRECARSGYDTLTLPTAEAIAKFQAEAHLHVETCMGKKVPK